MRWLVLAFAIWLSSDAAVAEGVRILSWNLNWFPSGSQTRAPAEEEARTISAAADTIRGSRADIVVLQEIRDGSIAEELAARVGEGFALVCCSNFREAVGGVQSWQQIAILSRIPALSAWSETWNTVGDVGPPRGFAFASFRIGQSSVAVYAVHLKSNLRSDDERTNQLNILKRELAIEQLLGHRRIAEKRVGGSFDVVVVAGDFNTNTDDSRFVSEGTLRNLAPAGFGTEFLESDPTRRVTVPAKGRYRAAVFDYIFQSGGAWESPVEVLASTLSDHFPVCGTVKLTSH